MTITWTRLALGDLAEARSYIAADNPGAAANLAHRVIEAVAVLSGFPEAGRQGRHPATREFSVTGTPYLIVYRADRDNVVILRVLNGNRQWPPGGR